MFIIIQSNSVHLGKRHNKQNMTAKKTVILVFKQATSNPSCFYNSFRFLSFWFGKVNLQIHTTNIYPLWAKTHELKTKLPIIELNTYILTRKVKSLMTSIVASILMHCLGVTSTYLHNKLQIVVYGIQKCRNCQKDIVTSSLQGTKYQIQNKYQNYQEKLPSRILKLFKFGDI